MKNFLTTLFLFASIISTAQKVDSIYFNLYTDSLKKGVHNYINVDGKLKEGRYTPLTSDEVIFSSSHGKWDGNSIIIDSLYAKDSVVITAKLKSNPTVTRSIIIYIKKFEAEERLRSEQEIIDGWRKNQKKTNLTT